MRAVVDTNVWLAGLIRPNGYARKIQDAAFSGAFQTVSCEATLTELKDVYSRLLRRYRLDLRDLNDVVRLMTESLFLPDPQVVPICRDPRDDVYAALAVAAAADYLVTRDDDLKGDEDVRRRLSDAGVQIVTIREFVAILGAEDA